MLDWVMRLLARGTHDAAEQAAREALDTQAERLREFSQQADDEVRTFRAHTKSKEALVESYRRTDRAIRR